ncbi:hypothetical protein ACEOSV_20990 [Pseudomonas aeruginosa]
MEIQQRNKKIVAVLVAMLVALVASPFLAWWFFLGKLGDNAISLSNSDWGAFGSFVGGVLAPPLAVISAVFLYLNIRIINSHHEEQMKIIAQQNRREMLVRLIEIYNVKLSEPLEKSFSKFIGRLKINIYTDNSLTWSPSSGPIINILVDLNLNRGRNRGQTRGFSREYIEFLNTVLANAELCCCKIIDTLLSATDQRELEDLADIAEALSDYHPTKALFELGVEKLAYHDEVHLMELLVKLNERTSYSKEIVGNYLMLKKEKSAS